MSVAGMNAFSLFRNLIPFKLDKFVYIITGKFFYSTFIVQYKDERKTYD